MPFKTIMHVLNFTKSTEIREIREKIYTRKLVHLGRHYPNSNSMTSSKIKNDILKTILVPWYRECFCFLIRGFLIF